MEEGQRGQGMKGGQRVSRKEDGSVYRTTRKKTVDNVGWISVNLLTLY